ncbi:MAG: TerB family tellurite resistance protein [bacterium]|nr:TerB family tellurite resistance protein [bacterium]
MSVRSNIVGGASARTPSASRPASFHGGLSNYGPTVQSKALRQQALTAPVRDARQAQQAFLVAMISLAAKVGKADGRVTEQEVRSFDAFLRDRPPGHVTRRPAPGGQLVQPGA